MICRRVVRVALSVCCAAAVLAGCGSAGGQHHAIDPSVQMKLRQDVRNLAGAAALHNASATQAALAAFNADVAAAHTAGGLSDGALSQIQAAAAAVQADLAATTTPPSKPTPTHHKGHGHDHGDGDSSSAGGDGG